MSKRYFIMITAALIFVLVNAINGQENWPQWRGPQQNGVSESRNLPTSWSQTENIIWSKELPSWSGGTPIIWDDQVFVTSPSEVDPNAAVEPQEPPSGRRGRRGEGRNPGGEALLVIAVSKKNGEELWRRELSEGNRLHRKQNNSSPSPVTDGKHLWVVTGTGIITAMDMSGKTKWHFDLQKAYGDFGLNWGYASSPLLYDDMLIVQVLHGMRTDDPSYVVAFDAATGREIWHQERPTDAVTESPDAYTTPTLLKYDGKTQIVISGGDYVTGHDPKTGRELWRSGGLNPEKRRNYRIIASPLSVDGMIYAPTRKTPLLALRAGGNDDVTTTTIAWKWEGAAAPDVPTPVCDGQYFYMVDDGGKVTCLNAKTGEVIWGPERTAQGIVSSSPLLADGKLYLTNEQAVTTILAAGPEFKQIATNELDGTYTLSSPVASGSHLFVRTSTHLYCIGNGSD